MAAGLTALVGAMEVFIVRTGAAGFGAIPAGIVAAALVEVAVVMTLGALDSSRRLDGGAEAGVS